MCRRRWTEVGSAVHEDERRRERRVGGLPALICQFRVWGARPWGRSRPFPPGDFLVAIHAGRLIRSAVSFSPAHDDDFHLAQECLEGKLSALEHLQAKYWQPLVAFLQSCGAHPAEAEEIVTQLWADCVTPRNGRKPKLAHYNGSCALKTFLSRVTMNVLIDLRRQQTRHTKLVPPAIGPDGAPSNGEDAPASGWATDAPEAALLDLMRSAVEAAFTSCPAEDFVLLLLSDRDNLRAPELAKMFGCCRDTLTSRLKDARRGIRKAAEQSIRARDPWLQLQWADFVELCRTASPACFGME